MKWTIYCTYRQKKQQLRKHIHVAIWKINWVRQTKNCLHWAIQVEWISQVLNFTDHERMRRVRIWRSLWKWAPKKSEKKTISFFYDLFFFIIKKNIQEWKLFDISSSLMFSFSESIWFTRYISVCCWRLMMNQTFSSKSTIFSREIWREKKLRKMKIMCVFLLFC